MPGMPKIVPSTEPSIEPTSLVTPEPRWPALITVLAAVGIHFALPASLRIGPPWIGPGVVLLTVAFGIWAAETGRHRLNQALGYLLATTLTVAVVFGVVRLVFGLVGKVESPAVLLRSAAILWATNVVTFALWYWRLDAGGPHARAKTAKHRGPRSAAFLFPQMMMIAEELPDELTEEWRPQFVDYLFLSFNTSTAFSPTDVPVLSRWAKVLTMVEAMISFTTVIVLIARAINTL